MALEESKLRAAWRQIAQGTSAGIIRGGRETSEDDQVPSDQEGREGDGVSRKRAMVVDWLAPALLPALLSLNIA